MRNLSTNWGPGEGKRGSIAGQGSLGNQAHAKYKVENINIDACMFYFESLNFRVSYLLLDTASFQLGKGK